MCLTVEPACSLDLVGDARVMPFSDASMDVVQNTQVLEHIPDPIAVIGEIRRVLKPGGTLLLSVQSIFPQHGSPGDYWRYMPQGLQWILRDFHNVTVKGEAGTVPSIFRSSTCIYSCSPARGRGCNDWCGGRSVQ